ncbi:hypothetical protein B0H19DRAFT_1080840 [Mycena capillaripes]|nr:hypothetical protein B0H19DRAFT_1080840 [Mycena capillaripes]
MSDGRLARWPQGNMQRVTSLPTSRLTYVSICQVLFMYQHPGTAFFTVFASPLQAISRLMSCHNLPWSSPQNGMWASPRILLERRRVVGAFKSILWFGSDRNFPNPEPQDGFGSALLANPEPNPEGLQQKSTQNPFEEIQVRKNSKSSNLEPHPGFGSGAVRVRFGFGIGSEPNPGNTTLRTDTSTLQNGLRRIARSVPPGMNVDQVRIQVEKQVESLVESLVEQAENVMILSLPTLYKPSAGLSVAAHRPGLKETSMRKSGLYRKAGVKRKKEIQGGVRLLCASSSLGSLASLSPCSIGGSSDRSRREYRNNLWVPIQSTQNPHCSASHESQILYQTSPPAYNVNLGQAHGQERLRHHQSGHVHLPSSSPPSSPVDGPRLNHQQDSVPAHSTHYSTHNPSSHHEAEPAPLYDWITLNTIGWKDEDKLSWQRCNWETWSWRARNTLCMFAGAWRWLDPHHTCPSAELAPRAHRIWVDNDVAVRSFIRLTCDPSEDVHIAHCTTAAAAWEALRARHAHRWALSRVNVAKEMYSIQFQADPRTWAATTAHLEKLNDAFYAAGTFFEFMVLFARFRSESPSVAEATSFLAHVRALQAAGTP